ncbi:HAD-IA family hydrolase [Novosphingobium marinum]|uniref:2-haloacid dehalogenase n=1 Tax=Novosphingobium marinum TaxID=1514948 RepID=A0A7Y9Y1D7_9SPHN|nr:HAD-IA family hydrolase [Novosphingobium marinum]NYH96943.1 2-haloacid dehalogenase [Novosphingobium marinum]
MSDIVEAVVFDVGRVLVQWDLRYLFGKLIPDAAELEWFLANVVTEEWHFEHDAGRQLHEMVAERKLQFPEHAHLIDAYATRFSETIPGRVPGTHELVERLAGKGVPLYAITNFAAPFWAEYHPTEPTFRHFGQIVVSGEERIAKPAAEIFRLAANRFGHEPRSMLFVDDNAANVEAARRLGWQVHHFRDAGLLEDDLGARHLI